jgi:2-oxo-hept-3-ene-1,7-dioate hydratase
VTLFDVLSATDYVVPAIEIIDARIEQFDRETKAMRKVFDTISDFAANAGIVLGGRPVRPLDVDLRWVGALLHKNGVIEETGLAAGVLNHPATGVAWLANKIAPYDEQLNAGDVVLAGSFTRPTTAQRGDAIHADYGPLGSVAFRLV